MGNNMEGNIKKEKNILQPKANTSSNIRNLERKKSSVNPWERI